MKYKIKEVQLKEFWRDKPILIQVCAIALLPVFIFIIIYALLEEEWYDITEAYSDLWSIATKGVEVL